MKENNQQNQIENSSEEFKCKVYQIPKDTNLEPEVILKALENNDSTIQLIDAKKLAGEKQIKFAVKVTNYSFETKSNIAETKDLEFLLRISGQKHIKKAIEMLDFTKSKEIAIISFPKNTEIFDKFEHLTGAKELVNHLKNNQDKETLIKAYNLQENELKLYKDNIEDLIIEKINLITVE